MEINAVVRKRGSGKINERGMRREGGGQKGNKDAKDEKTKKRDRTGDVLLDGGELSAR